jgi:hypothetical protein
MTKPRYDPEENVTRHGATSPKKCKDMEKRRGWQLVDIEDASGSMLKVDCVFKGDVRSPPVVLDFR